MDRCFSKYVFYNSGKNLWKVSVKKPLQKFQAVGLQLYQKLTPWHLFLKNCHQKRS